MDRDIYMFVCTYKIVGENGSDVNQIREQHIANDTTPLAQ